MILLGHSWDNITFQGDPSMWRTFYDASMRLQELPSAVRPSHRFPTQGASLGGATVASLPHAGSFPRRCDRRIACPLAIILLHLGESKVRVDVAWRRGAYLGLPPESGDRRRVIPIGLIGLGGGEKTHELAMLLGVSRNVRCVRSCSIENGGAFRPLASAWKRPVQAATSKPKRRK